MTESALLTKLKELLVAQQWTGSSNVVFAAVNIVADIPSGFRAALENRRFPCVLLSCSGGESDPEFDEEPDLLRSQIDGAILQMVGGDNIGEFVVMGGALSGGATKSEGQGLETLQQQYYNAIGKVNGLEAVILQSRQKSEQGSVYDPNGRNWLGYRIIRSEAWCTTV